MYNLLFWISAQAILLWALGELSRDYRNKKAYKLVFLPSALFEGLLRLTACCFSSLRVKSVDFFEDDWPFAEEGTTRIPVLGPVAFLLMWLGGFYICFMLMATSIDSFSVHATTLPHVDPVVISTGVVKVDARAYLAGVDAFLAETDWGSPWVWFLIYWTVGCFPYFGLAFRHVRCGFLVVVLLAVVTFAANHFGVRAGFLSKGWFMTYWVLPEHFRVYSLFVTLLGWTVCAHIVGRLLRRLFALWGQRTAAHLEDDREARKFAHSHSV